LVGSWHNIAIALTTPESAGQLAVGQQLGNYSEAQLLDNCISRRERKFNQ